MGRKKKQLDEHIDIQSLIDGVANYNEDDMFFVPLEISYDDDDDGVSFEHMTPVDTLAAMPLLSQEEEHDLAIAYHDHGDMNAYEILIERNMRLVIKCAWRIHKGRGKYALADIDDMISEGALGLMHAVTKYDPHRGIKLSTYAYPWIVQKIARYVSSQHPIFRIPYNVGAWIAQHSNAVAKWKDGRLDELSQDEIAKLTQYVFLMHPYISLNEPINEDWNNPLSENLSDDIFDDVSDNKVDVQAALSFLSVEERELIAEVFGIREYSKETKSKTLDKIAKKYKLTKNELNDKVNEILNKIRAGWNIAVIN